MRRGFAFLFAVIVFELTASAALGQYPYPYGPMPYAPMPAQYMTPYGPMPMPARPMYYAPAPPMQPPMPMWQAPQKNTRVFVYGPLTDETVIIPPANPIVAPPNPVAAPSNPQAPPAPIAQTQALLTRGGPTTLPTYSKMDLPPDACGPDCGDRSCAPKSYEPPIRGKGHFIGETAAIFFVPFSVNRNAFNTTTAGAATTTEFARPVDYGSHASLGYMFHTGWGIRADYEYLRGTSNTSLNNTNLATTITTPGPFPITSAGAALNDGIGVDQLAFRQRLELNVADVELLKEMSFFDTTLLFGAGARYARMTQSYAATRTNPGGSNGAVTVVLDRDDANIFNRFEGYGPTVDFEFVHPMNCGFSIYGTVRGSFLFGNDQFSQSFNRQDRTVNAAGVPVFVDSGIAHDVNDKRFVSVLETEAGLQYGCRVKGCYLFARAGVAYTRWWDIGSPTTARGDISFAGGVVRMGITY